jgi:hypothetical protein
MDIQDLINKVFDDEIKEPNSIGVSFEGMDNTSELFETFLTIFTEGMKMHYGNNGIVDLNSITGEQFTKIVRYFASIGIQLYYHKFHILQLEKLENTFSTDNISFKYDLNDSSVNVDNILQNYTDKPTKELLIPYKQVSSDNLEDYKFQIRVKDNVYVLYFKFL